MSKTSDVLKDLAPTLAGAISGVFGGPAVGLAVKTLGEKLLGKPNATRSEVEKALVTASPEQLLELKKLDTSFKQSMLDFGYKIEELEVRDRIDARQRDKEFIRAGRVNLRADILAYIATGSFIGLAFATLLGPRLGIGTIDQATKEILMYVLGSLNTIVVMIFSFEFGSSKDAAKMQNTMKEWMDKT